MPHRQLRLFVLVAVIISGIMVTADAGGRKRRTYLPAAGPNAVDDSGRLESVTSICPIFVFMNHGSYCSWYSIQCDGDTPVSPPVAYDTACDAGPRIPCAGCYPVQFSQGGYETAYKTGYPAPLRPRIQVVENGTAELRDDPQSMHTVTIKYRNTVFVDEIVRLDHDNANGREARVHLLSLVTMPDRSTLGTIPYASKMGPILTHIGYEVDPETNPQTIPDLSSKPHPDAAYTGVRIVNFQGNDYSVLLMQRP